MNYQHYLDVGFQFVGFLTKSESVKKKYKVEMRYKKTFIPENRMGVYILADDKGNVLKIGETQNLRHRFSCYESHSGPTNKMIRENIEMNDIGNPNGYGNDVDEYRTYIDGKHHKTI